MASPPDRAQLAAITIVQIMGRGFQAWLRGKDIRVVDVRNEIAGLIRNEIDEAKAEARNELELKD